MLNSSEKTSTLLSPLTLELTSKPTKDTVSGLNYSEPTLMFLKKNSSENTPTNVLLKPENSNSSSEPSTPSPPPFLSSNSNTSSLTTINSSMLKDKSKNPWNLKSKKKFKP